MELGEYQDDAARIERRPKFNDITEEKQNELKELERGKDPYMDLLNQDSFIDGTFQLDNTHSLEKFREIEKMCESQVDASQDLRMDPKLLDRRTPEEAAAQVSGEIPPELTPDAGLELCSGEVPDGSDGDAVHAEAGRRADAPDQQDCSNLHTEHYQQTLNTMVNLRLLEPHSEKYLELEKVRLPDPNPKILELWSEADGEPGQEGSTGLRSQAPNAKVLFLDIDETMVHCIDDRDPSSMKGEVRL